MPQVSLYFHTYDVVASPADDTETVIAIITDVDTIWPGGPINLHGWVNVQIDADATTASLAVRRGSLSGDVVGSPAQIQFADAGTLGQATIDIDVQDTPGDVASATYVLTLTCESAADVSTVVGVHLSAQV